MSDRVRWLAGKTWPKLALALAIGWQAHVVACVAVAKEPSKPAATGTNTPEEALKDFLAAMIENDQAGIQRTALPNPELSLLWHSDKLTPAQKAIARAEINPSSFRRLKVGDRVKLPGGQKIVFDKNWINDRRQAISVSDGPLPFILVKVKDEWRVDATPLIAGRLAAAAVGERHTAAGRPNWVPDAKLLNQLGDETTIDGLKIRIPAGFRPVKTEVPGHSSAWVGTKRPDGTFPEIVIYVVPASDYGNRPLTSRLEFTLPELQKEYGKDWSQSAVELGRIDDLVCARARWSGTGTAGPKELVGKKMQGAIYLMEHGDMLVEVMIRDQWAEGKNSFPLCEASVLTLRRAARKPAADRASARDKPNPSGPR
ncbi:MAG TPA: hypothetical protein VGP63_12575 [Planctomycetaceae bacterium]|jgi:hypothetical protein|nr:hypothetical protein [Planctomycetaceae bacterium]